MGKSDDGMWAQVAKLAAVDGAENDQFGWSVSVSGSTVVVGARLDDDDSLSNSGAAYVFEKSDVGEWVQTKLTADDAAQTDWFGVSVSVSGSTVVVGAVYRDDDSSSNSGAAYVFEKSDNGTWVQTKLTADDAAADDIFGNSVSVSGSTVVVGAHFDDDAGDNSGSGYIWMLSIPSLRPCTCCERSMKSMGFTVGAEDCDPEATPDDLDFQSSR